MTDHHAPPVGPDLTRGIRMDSLADGGMLVGRVGDESVLLTRTADQFFATGATCTHYGAPLSKGLVVDGTIRCPWHHARFSLATGEALRAPALNPIASWVVQRRDDMVFVERKRELSDRVVPPVDPQSSSNPPTSIVIIGAGAAGNAAAEMLRREGYKGSITMFGAEADGPYDRPNLSKDYLAGDAPEEWIPLRPREFYDRHAITLRSEVRVTAIDRAKRRVTLDRGEAAPFDRLLIATGAKPVRLHVPGSWRAHVHYLRSLSECRAIIAAAATARRAVVIGASFIGLEVAASLRKRGLNVHVVGRERRPLERVFGPDVGDMIRALHEANEVVFHLGETVAAIGETNVTLDGGAVIPADMVVIGIGVEPQIALAADAGIEIDHGIVVNEYLETSEEGIFAAGDIARWPDPHSGARIRVEHWVVAEQQGQVAARNMLAGGDRSDRSRRESFTAVPFFWSHHYDVSIRYVGHAERWDDIVIDGELAAHDATVTFNAEGKTMAVATIGRDRVSLEAEAAMEHAAALALHHPRAF